MSFLVDFRTVSSIYNTPFSNFWGNNSQYSLNSTTGLLLGSGPTNDYAAMGIMQPPSGKTAGEGYGAFSFIARYEYGGQGGGDYLLLWRADNNWLMQSEPNTITEADMLESWDKSVTEQSTLHFWSATASGNDGQTFHGTTGIDLTKLHVYTMHWEAGSLSFYIDETLIYTVTGSTVPKDAADGDCNYCMGMGCETETAPVGMYVTIAQYVASADMAAVGGISGILSKLVAEAGGAATTAPTTGTAASSGSSGSGASGSATGTPVAATGNQSLVITAAEQTGTTLAMSFTLAEEATLVLAGQVAGGAMTPIGTYWDNCKPGTQTLQPYYQPVPANLVEIQLTAGSTVTKFAVTQAGAAATAPAGGTTTASTYTLAQLTAAVDAELASGAKAAAMEAAVSALFAKYIAANPSA